LFTTAGFGGVKQLLASSPRLWHRLCAGGALRTGGFKGSMQHPF